MAFRGRSQRSIDAKGRMMLSPEFRQEALGNCAEGSIMFTNLDDCIVCYPMSKWEEIEAAFSQARNPDKALRGFIRFFIGGAEQVAVDSHGRVLIPQMLREYAGLDKEVVVVGVGYKFEIWDKARYNTIMASQNLDAIEPKLAEAGVQVAF